MEKKARVTFDEEGIVASKPAAAIGGAGAASAVAAADPEFGLLKQDLTTLDVSVLTPLTPEIISRQATINIGTIGHVAHGKTTVVRSISGVKVRPGRGGGVGRGAGRYFPHARPVRPPR